jgi:hypothetical protein
MNTSGRTHIDYFSLDVEGRKWLFHSPLIGNI